MIMGAGLTKHSFETFISATQYNTVDFTLLILNKQAIFQNNSQYYTLNSNHMSTPLYWLIMNTNENFRGVSPTCTDFKSENIKF